MHPKPAKPLSAEVHIIYLIYTGTRRRVDDLNLYEALDDILVSERILEDDNRNIIRCRDGSRVLYDKENPRAEVYIYEYTKEDDHWLRTEPKCTPSTSSSESMRAQTDSQN